MRDVWCEGCGVWDRGCMCADEELNRQSCSYILVQPSPVAWHSAPWHSTSLSVQLYPPTEEHTAH